MELQKKLQENWSLRVPEGTTNECLNTDVLSAVRKGYPHIMFVWATGQST